MSDLKQVTMTREEYEAYCEFLKQKKASNSLIASRISSNDNDPIYNSAISEISHGFSPDIFEALKDKITLWKYPKGTVIDLSTDSAKYLGYLVAGVIQSTLNSEFLNFTTPKNWLGTVKISQALICDDDDESWEKIINYSSNVQMIAQTNIIFAMIEIDREIIHKLKGDHVFKNTLLLDLTGIIKANDALQYLLMHRNKVSIMASYLLWKIEKENITIWKPVPTALSERLNFSLSDTRRSIDKLLEKKIIIAGDDFKRNTKKKFYYFADDAKEKLLGLSGLDLNQISDLSRILFDSSCGEY